MISAYDPFGGALPGGAIDTEGDGPRTDLDRGGLEPLVVGVLGCELFLEDNPGARTGFIGF
jgi:hypothetical protein